MDSSQLVNLFLMNTVGMSILVETIREAGWMFAHSNGISGKSRSQVVQMKESKQCFAFIRGSGLEILIQSYGLGYDAEELRKTFYNTFHLRKYLD